MSYSRNITMPDILTPEQRSHRMSLVKQRDTDIELALRSELHARGLRFRKNLKSLPGSPDIVFTKTKIAIFVDGHFWHGYQFSKWKHKLTPFWCKKIEDNIKRDRRNFRKLRQSGWLVIRFWQHEVEKNLSTSADRIERLVKERLA